MGEESSHSKIHKMTSKHHRHPTEIDVHVDTDNAATAEASDLEERRLKRRIKRAKKIAKHLAELGLDEEGNELDNFSLDKYPVREYKFTIPGMRDEVAINPIVTLLAVVCLWSVVLWCAVDASQALLKLSEWQSALSINFTWFTQSTKAIFFVFICFVALKYGHIKLGAKDDKPEFSTLTYTIMMYVAIVSNAAFLSSVSEPMMMQSDNFFTNTGYRSQDEIDLFAINMTMTNWGLAGWATGAVVALTMSLAVYRFGLPMTFRSCFYPILGQYTWGWMGDLIDGFIIVATLSGVCTSLVMTPSSFVAGLIHLKWIDADAAEGHITAIQNCIVWVLSIITLASVISGLRGGIRWFCVAGMGIGCLAMVMIFVMDDSKYILNLQVQEVGTYLQSSIFELNLWTDAFGQLRQGSGRAVDGKASDPLWASYWVNFYQLWWATGSGGIGMYVACISRGRHVWEVLLHAVVAPVVYSMIWFCVWGGVGLRQSRQAMELEILGETYFNNSAHFLIDGSEFCYNVPQEDVFVNDELVFTNYLRGVSPVCKFDVEDPDSAAFNVMDSYTFRFEKGGYGPILTFLFLLGNAVSFMSNTGAMSLMVDKMASSGRKNDHLARRVYWLVTAAVLATTLLGTGGDDALSAFQAAMIMCGLPCSILLCFVLQALLLMCEQAAKTSKVVDYEFPNQAEFTMPVYGGVFNVFEYCASCGKVNPARMERGVGNATMLHVVEFVKGLVLPFVTLHKVLAVTYPQNSRTNAAVTGCYAMIYVVWIGLCAATLANEGLAGAAWTAFAVHGIILAAVRKGFRMKHDLRSNVIADVLCSALLWPQVLSQMSLFHATAEKSNAVVASHPVAVTTSNTVEC